MRRPLALAAWLALALACTFDGSALLSAGPPTSDGTSPGGSATSTGDGASTGHVTTGVDTGGGTGGGTTTSLPETTAVDSASTGSGGPACGDGVLQADEACDGADLGGKSCADFGLGAGALACTAACTIDLTGCAPPQTCGDGTLDGDEQCEGADLGGQTCQSLGYAGGGTLKCSATCNHDVSGCVNIVCGNGQCQPGEDSCNCPGDCPDDPNSCSSCQCGQSGGNCYCDDACVIFGDCCFDGPC